MSASAIEETALVVYESMYDNTAHVAEAIAQGLELGGMTVRVVNVTAAPAIDTIDADLLVVGAPTHAFSLSRQSSREDAVQKGAKAERAQVGVREWLAAGRPSARSATRLAAVFDTRVRKVRHLKAAASRARRVLGHLGFTLVERPMGFLVDDLKGPLVEGETDRALSWGLELAGACHRHAASLTAG
ncbi:MAG: flavodoxin domain-containing protein [Marmoricola sp.]